MTPKADKPLSVRPTKPATAPRTSPAKRAVPPSAGATRSAKPTVTPTVTVTAKPASALPPAAAAAGAFVGDLQAGVADGQVAQPAGQDLFTHLQQALFGPPGQQAQQQYQQLVQAYDQHLSQGQISGAAVGRLRHALDALGAALGIG